MFEKSIVIDNPPTFVEFVNGKGQQKKLYLTANLFYSNLNKHNKSKIVRDLKRYLLPYFKDIPKLKKARLTIIYQKETTGFDLDNKAFFWQKLVLDILKSYTPKQVLQMYKRRKEPITVSALKDDTVKYVDKISYEYLNGPECLIVKIEGVKL